MPEIGFDKESLRVCGLQGLVTYLDDVMLYPNLTVEEITKRQICRWTHEKIYALEIAPVQDNSESTFSLEEAKSLASFDIEKLESEINYRRIHGFYAGSIISYIWKLDINGLSGSVGKSVYLLENLSGVSESFIRKCWSKYNSVAHFYAAKEICDYLLHHNSINCDASVDDFVRFLSLEQKESYRRNALFVCLSKYLYKFSISRIEHKTKEPLLDPEKTWIFSDELLPINGNFDRVTAIFDAAKWPMTEAELAALKTYKANKY